MVVTEVTLASVEQAGVVARLLYDFNAEFETSGPTAEEFTGRFRLLLVRDDVLVLLSGNPETPTGFAFLTLRPPRTTTAPWLSSRSSTWSPTCATKASALPC